MAVSNEEINAWLQANAGASDATIAQAMNQYGVSTAQMAQATGLGQDAVQSRYDAAIAPQAPAAPLYQGLTATSTPEQIAQAYSQFTSGAGGDTAANQQEAMAFLQSLGVSQPTIEQAYTTYTAPKFAQPFQEEQVDPYVYAYEYGVANNDFSGLLGLLKQTPDSTALISKYGLTPEQINQIEFGTGFDLDQSGGYGAGKVGNDWDYKAYLDKLRAGDEESVGEGLRMLASADPLMANSVRSLYDELRAQQQVTGDAWATGKLGSKDAAAMDFALRLAENGISSVYDLGQRTVERVADGYNGPEVVQDVEYFNKRTGEALPDWGRVSRAGGLDLEYNLSFAADGTPIPYTMKERSDWMNFREDFLKPAASFVAMANPALAPYLAAGNALNAASKGDWGSAIVSGLTAAVGFKGDLGLSASTVDTLSKAKTGAQVLNAIDKGNPIAIANALAQTSTGKEMLSSDMGGGVTLGNVLDTAKIATSVNAGDYASALNYAGSLTNSPDLRVAGSSAALLNAMKSGDPFKIATAMGQLDKAVKTATKDSGKQAPVEDMKPTSYGTNITEQLTDAGLIDERGQFADAGSLTDEAVASIFGDAPGSYTDVPVAGPGAVSGIAVPKWLSTSKNEQVVDVAKGDEGQDVYYVQSVNPNNPEQSATYKVDRDSETGKIYYQVVDSYGVTDKNVLVQAGQTKPKFDWESEEKSALTGLPEDDALSFESFADSSREPDGSRQLADMLSGIRNPSGATGAGTLTGGGVGADTGAGLGVGTGAGGDAGFGAGTGAGTGTGTGAGGGGFGAGSGTGAGGNGSGGDDLDDVLGLDGGDSGVVTAPAKPATPEKPAVAPAKPAVPAAPAKPTTPTQVAEAKKQIALTLNLPASSPVVQDIFEALYGTMEYLDIGEEFEPSARKARPAATQKQLQQTKMAQGGYLDDLLAENMSADDLLNLLR
jgi:hypothetical protein